MPRTPRYRCQSICYHLYNRGFNRSILFHDDADFHRFSGIVAAYKKQLPVRLYHWAWMPNHYHMLVQVPFTELRRFISGVQQTFAQYHHHRHETCGPVFQGRYHAKAVEQNECLTRCGRYIERNAFRARMVIEPWAYPWCSAGYYVSGLADGVSDLDPQFSDPLDPGARHAYANMLLDEADDLWMSQQNDLVIGSSKFLDRLTMEQGRSRARRGPRARIHR